MTWLALGYLLVPLVVVVVVPVTTTRRWHTRHHRTFRALCDHCAHDHYPATRARSRP